MSAGGALFPDILGRTAVFRAVFAVDVSGRFPSCSPMEPRNLWTMALWKPLCGAQNFRREISGILTDTSIIIMEGKYFAVFLTKISGCSVAVTYNLMRTFRGGPCFCASFFPGISDDRGHFRKGPYRQKKSPSLSRRHSCGGGVSLAGNMHYVIYSKILPLDPKAEGNGVRDRLIGFRMPPEYIGYDPDVPDKTIHEFPSYSFVLGDLHAHVVNIMFC